MIIGVTNVKNLIKSSYDIVRGGLNVCYKSICKEMYNSEYIFLIGKNKFSLIKRHISL